MSYVVILDFEYSDGQKTKWSEVGLPESQGLSWQPERRNNDGFRKLFSSSTRNTLIEPYEIIDVPVKVSECVLNLTKYMEVFFHNAAVNLRKRLDNRKTIQLVVVNFAPFTLSRAIADQILSAFSSALNSLSIFRKSRSFLFLSRNVNSFTQSEMFKVITNENPDRKINLLDTEFETVSCEKGVVDSKTNNYNKELSETLQFKKPNGYYESFIYGTNTYIGHFDLVSSHVRTHYQLYSFVTRDDVTYYLNDEITRLCDGKKNTIFGIGLEQSVVDYLGTGLSVSDPVKFKYIALFKQNYQKTELKAFIGDSNCIIILTDIVNSRSTIHSAIKKIEGANLSKIPIKVFSVVVMNNTKKNTDFGQKIHSSLIIKRDFYEPGNCFLCDIEQPKQPVLRVTDFEKVDKIQLTPYDFWEIVSDSKALLRDDYDYQGRRFNFRIETSLIIDKYSHWLSNVINSKYTQHWRNDFPDVICTIDDPPSVRFAELVCKSLNMEPDSIEILSRNDLRKVTPSGDIPNSLRKYEGLRKVLIVDDGINSGDTVQSIIELWRKFGTAIMGVFVFDCRLTNNQINRLEYNMNANIVSLYNWQLSEWALL